MTMSTDTLCWWELVIAVAGLVVSAVTLPAAITEDNKATAWAAAVAFAAFSVVAATCFWRLWDV